MTAKLLPKLTRDTATLALAFGFLVFMFYALRRVDPGATVDGLGGLFVALQVIIIGFASASAAGAICWLLFGMMGRAISVEVAMESWIGLCTVIMHRVTWLAIFYLLFSRAVGQ